MSKLPKKIIGITGKICAGKSEVSKYLKEKGYDIIDGDEITNQLYLNNLEFKQAMINLLGKDIIKDNNIDKARVAEIVFTDKAKLNKLNKLIQPFIIKNIQDQITKLEGLFFIDGALLFQMKLNKYCDKIIYLSTQPELQLARLQSRNQISKEKALERINAQNNFEIDHNLIDYWIDNSYGKEDLYQEIEKILEIEG